MRTPKLLSTLLCATCIILLAACGTSQTNLSEVETEVTKETVQENAESSTEEAGNEDAGNEEAMNGERGMGGRNGGGGAMGAGGTTENSAAIQAVLDENADKFEQFTYTDEETGASFEYNLYIPEDYDESQSYPLLLYITDSTGTGKSATELAEQYYGGTVWVTEEEQAKHASFVLVPAYTETAADDNWNVSDEVKATVRLIEQLEETYSIDSNRLYTTGQSGGCMCSFYFNSTYPDMFAASMYVSGQWDISVLSTLENQKFFYITAGGDEKASGGQDEVMAMLDGDDISYSYGTWNAQNSDEEQTAAVDELLAKGYDANMIRFETGSVFADGQSGMEHMASFNYGYSLTAVRDWLFEQVKE